MENNNTNSENNMEKPPKTWTRDEIIALLDRNPKAVDRAMPQLIEHIDKGITTEDIQHIRRFNQYVQGLDEGDRPKWKPKSLSCGHAKIFIAQGFVPSGTRTLDFAREIAKRYVRILVDVANGDPVKPTYAFLYTIRRGRYADTEEMWAYHNDFLPEEENQFPYDCKHRGSPTPGDYATLRTKYETKGQQTPMTEHVFLTQYTLVYKRHYYLD